MAQAFDFPYEYPDVILYKYPEVDPYIKTYFEIVAPRPSKERWVQRVDPNDLWDKLGDFAWLNFEDHLDLMVIATGLPQIKPSKIITPTSDQIAMDISRVFEIGR